MYVCMHNIHMYKWTTNQAVNKGGNLATSYQNQTTLHYTAQLSFDYRYVIEASVKWKAKYDPCNVNMQLVTTRPT